MDDLLLLLTQPLLEAWRGLRAARLAADAAWFDALESDDDDALGAAIDRHLVCLTVQTGLVLRHTDGALDDLSVAELDALLEIVPASVQSAVEHAVSLRLDALDDEALTRRARAILCDPNRRADAGLATTLAERGHVDLALPALREVEYLHTWLDGAESLWPRLDDAARTSLARRAWHLVDHDRGLDAFGEYGAAVSYACRLRAVTLWPVGAPEAVTRLRLLERHLAFITPHEWAGSQDHPDLRLLLALAWAHHGDESRALRGYQAIGEDRVHWAGELGEKLPHLATSLAEEAVRLQMQACRAEQAERGETWIWPATVLELLDRAAPRLAETLLSVVDEVFGASDAHGDLWRIALVPYLPTEAAAQLWQAQLAAVTDRADEPEVDARLDALVTVMAYGGESVVDAVLDLLARWPRPEPFDGLEDSWPDDDLARPLEVLLARPDVASRNTWGRLVDDLVARAPALATKLPSDWPRSVRQPGGRRLWIEPSTVEHLVGELSAEAQRLGLEIYADTLAPDGSLADREVVLARLRTPREPWTADASGQPPRSWRAAVDRHLADDDLTALEGMFGLFASRETTGEGPAVWLTHRLLEEEPARTRWLRWLATHARPLWTASVLDTVLGRGVGSPEARRACLEVLAGAARVALGAREAPRVDTFHQWGPVIRWASEETVRHLWSRRFCGASGGAVAYAELEMAVRLGGVQRLRAAFEALRYVVEMPR